MKSNPINVNGSLEIVLPLEQNNFIELLLLQIFQTDKEVIKTIYSSGRYAYEAAPKLKEILFGVPWLETGECLCCLYGWGHHIRPYAWVFTPLDPRDVC